MKMKYLLLLLLQPQNVQDTMSSKNKIKKRTQYETFAKLNRLYICSFSAVVDFEYH